MHLNWWCAGDPYRDKKPCGWIADETYMPLMVEDQMRYFCPRCGGLANRKNFAPDASPETVASAIAEDAAEYRRLLEERGQLRLLP